MTSISTNQFGSGGSNGGSASRPHGRDMVIWTEEMNEYLIDALMHQQDIGNRSAEGRFLTGAYESVITGVGERFGVVIDRSNIKNRLKHVKDMFHECENLFDKQSGIKWNPATRRFHADPQVWREFIERKPEAKKWMTKTIDHYDRLLELFGKDRAPPASENLKGPSKKKARIEPPKDRPQRHQTSSNGFELAIVQGSNQVMDKNELPGAVVAENNIIGELDLSELCKSENGLVAIPVHGNAYGKGLPYAPENWPSPGDQWQWKVGNRIAAGGHWVDRYLAPPSRFRDATGKKTTFTSRLKVGEFIKSNFPDVDPSTFFSMFIWKIPAAEGGIQGGTLQVERVEPEDGLADPDGPCKARNKACNLGKEGFIESSPAGNCDICCVHPDFCRTCCCILCGKAVNNSFGGYSYIKCEAVVAENYICGHVAHLDCALRIFMAGTVGGSIGLDVQYYCRRCDNKTNLMMHVEKLLETCRSLGSRSEIEPILNMGLCILRGSRQLQAKSLEDYMASVMAKVNNGVDLAEVWNMEDGDGMPILNAEESSPPIAGVTVLGADPQYPYLTDPMVDNELQRAAESVPIFITGNHTEMSLKFEDEIDNSLLELKKSQEAEYRLAEQKLYSQKDYILSLYRQLESDRSQLADPNPVSDISSYSVLLSNITNRVEQVKSEEEKFQTMLKISKGFRKAPANIKEHFGLPPPAE
ncbi:hypothetical protein CFC21_073508 [Triticum aestivum]|uniref:Uncharacterized protein n=3 Tax=Triticum TaxID=4564 RepID=A0A9R1AQP4_TRITD|nr:uncharacterized protein LOC119311798 [Triticum dicoccoides]XP_037443397.1 uncharacterized protein LOC119311798 [Triticum dicoccoides]XP_044390430.1 uncharacterized protein LOC123113299 [Triticum aestivum]KAF7067646.1 hypothetical protein CFC21_073508 [Triticum aestivum]VAI36620.1 unnamed protein product [Triticum turgidum subsp. durum]